MRSTDPRLEPIDKANDMGMVQPLEHLQLVIHHLLVALHVLLQDNLDGDLARGAVGLPDDAIGTSTQSPTEFVSASKPFASVAALTSSHLAESWAHTSCRSSRAGHEGG